MFKVESVGANMEKLVERLNDGNSHETEAYLRKEFFYLLQISTLFCHLRSPRWLVLHFVHVFVFFFCKIYITISMLIASYSLKKDQVGLMGQAFHVAAGMILAMSIGCLGIAHRKHFTQIFALMSSNNYNYGHSLVIQEISDYWKQDMNKFKKTLFSTLPLYIALIGFVGFIFNPILDRMQGVTLQVSFIDNVYMELPLPLWVPFNVTNAYQHYALQLFEMLSAIVILVQICAGTLFVIFVTLSLNTQLRILIHSIKNLEKRAWENFKHKYGDAQISADFNVYKNQLFCNEFEKCLKQNIEHHQIIIRGAYHFDIAQRWAMFTAVFVMALVIACAIFTLIKGDERVSPQLWSGLLLLLETASIAIICWRGQELIDLSEELSTTLFNTNWIQYPKNIQRSIIIMQERCKQPLSIKAGGFVVNPVLINWELFSSIMNSAYTWFNLMYAMK